MHGHGYVTAEGSLEAELARRERALEEPETEIEKERRLEREARERFLGELLESPTARGDRVRVEVTIGEPRGWTTLERSGYYFVRLVEIPAELLEGMDEAAALEQHPATRAGELVRLELERRYPDADYRSVDDAYAA